MICTLDAAPDYSPRLKTLILSLSLYGFGYLLALDFVGTPLLPAVVFTVESMAYTENSGSLRSSLQSTFCILTAVHLKDTIVDPDKLTSVKMDVYRVMRPAN